MAARRSGAAASGSPVLARAFGVAPGASEVGGFAGFSGAGSGSGTGSVSGTISASPGCADVSIAVALNTRYGLFCDAANT